MAAGPEQKGTAILALTANGASLARRIARDMEHAVVFLPARLKGSHNGDQDISPIYFEQWGEILAYTFSRFSHLICIMATGIVVRGLAPLVQSKYQDPAVLVIDEKGSFVISLLSGHIGGGNRVAQRVAAIIKAQPVITTATDIQQKPALDLLAQKMDATLEPRDRVKIISRLLVENQQVNLYSNLPLIPLIKEGFHDRGWPWGQVLSFVRRKAALQPIRGGEQNSTGYQEPAVVISHQIMDLAGHNDLVRIIPRNLFMGIGCRRGVAPESLYEAYRQVLDQYAVDAAGIKALATIDFKTEETGIRMLARDLGLPLVAVGKQEIQELEVDFTPSQWVYENIGVGGVCEPAAIIAAQMGYLMVPKQKIGPVTISIAMEKSWWLDWDRATGTC